MAIGISFKNHIKTQALPKLKEDSDKEMFKWMAERVEEIGEDCYDMYPKEILAHMEHHEIKSWDKYSVRNWLDFLSFLPVAKYFETQNIKKNRIKLRRKINEISNKESPSQSDIKIIDTLRTIVEEADSKTDDLVTTYTTFYPPRTNYKTEQTQEEKNAIQEELKNVILSLGLDTDYMSYMNTELDREKQKKEEAKIASLKASVTEREKIANIETARPKARSKFDELKNKIGGE